jgi:tRNA (guanine37-N1)-methyltransferase
MIEKLKALEKELESIVLNNADETEQFRLKYLSRKGLLNDLFEEFKNVLPFKRALEKNLISLNIINLRDFAIDERGSVDDRPYGGGGGMILRVEPIVEALNTLTNKEEVIVLNPKGDLFNQEMAEELTSKKSLTFICGRYEGIDQRVIDNYSTKEISVGKFVCSGGEAPTIVILESILRLLPGVLDEEITKDESYQDGQKEYPQYTRPENYEGLKVPEVLLSGNHKEIENWKKENSITL